MSYSWISKFQGISRETLVVFKVYTDNRIIPRYIEVPTQLRRLSLKVNSTDLDQKMAFIWIRAVELGAQLTRFYNIFFIEIPFLSMYVSIR